MAVEQWMVWTGKLKLASRSADGGEEVTARIVAKPDVEVEVEMSRGNDAFGQPRWEAAGPHTFDARSLLRALASTGKAVDPATTVNISVQPASEALVVVVLLAEPLLGVREYIRNFFEPGVQFVEPNRILLSPPIDVLVVERGARDVDLSFLKARLTPGGVVLPVDFARGTMTVTTDQPHPTVRETACAVLREAGYDIVPTIRWEDIRAWLIDVGREVIAPERPDGMACVKRGEDVVTVRPDHSEETLATLTRLFGGCSVRELRARIERHAKAVQERTAKLAALPFKAHVPTRYTTWTAKTDMAVHWHPVHAGETVTVAERGDEVFVRIPRVGGGWLAPGKIPERVAAAIQEDLDRLGSAFVRLIKPDDGGEWIARRVDPAHVRRDGGKWVPAAPAPVHAATSIAPIYYVFRNNLTSTTAEAVTITTE